MPARLRKVAFVVEDFSVGSPAQQLLDRFLIGYPHNGGFKRLKLDGVAVCLVDAGENSEIERRVKDFGLVRAPGISQCVADADGVVVVPRSLVSNGTLARSVLEHVPRGANCFVYGTLADSGQEAGDLIENAKSRRSSIAAGTATASAWRLPAVAVPSRKLRQALIVVQGEYPSAEVEALNGLLPAIEERSGGETGIKQAEALREATLWEALEGPFASLLASALSRSDMPQGDAVADSRTQDLVRLGLVRKLAESPRGWLLHHNDELRTLVVVLDGVVADYNVAIQTDSGGIVSWQLYRPPAPMHHHFSNLADTIEVFLRRGSRRLADRSLTIAHILGLLSQA